MALRAVQDIGGLLGLEQFLVAHRGSGDNWPEHTLTAYRAALAAGAQAVEISVRATADHQLVCHHDADLSRTTGSSARVSETAFADLPRVDARRWLGPATALEPIPLLDDVLAALPDTALAFVEDKDGTNTWALLEALDAQPRATDRFVWKQWAVASQVRAARGRGYRAWGYFGADDLDRVAEFADSFDCLGVPVDAPDEAIRRITTRDTPVMAWAVHTRSQAARLADLGVRGLMCSNVPYVLAAEDPASIDAFDTGRRAPGDLPRDASDLWQRQPDLVDDALRFTTESASSYLLGSVCPLPERCNITLRLGWSGTPSGMTGVAFGMADDSDYEAGSAHNTTGAHRAGITEDGHLVLWDDPPGEDPRPIRHDDPTVVATNGSAMLQLWLNEDTWAVRLDSGAELRLPRHHHGGYLWLWADEPASGASLSQIRIG